MKKYPMLSCPAVFTPLLLFVFFIFTTAQAGPLPFIEDFESDLSAWTTNGLWGLTDATAHSPSQALTDSPGAYYTNGTDSTVTMISGMDLSAAVRPALRLYVRHQLETDYDFADLEVSTNAGLSWGVLDHYNGNQADWAHRQYNLDEIAGQSDVRLRVHMQTDSSVVMDGIYLDDIYAGERPEATPILATAASQTQARLEWAASGDADFSAYRIYRGLGTNADASARVPVATLTEASVTQWTDIAVSPKSGYTYALTVWNSHELGSTASVISVQTPAGMDYPFLDNGEGGGGLWSADGGWALSTNASFSSAHAWTDSPDGNYTNSQNTALTLSTIMDLHGAAHPVLCYATRYHLLSGDNGYVEISTNSGSAWTTLATYAAGSNDWIRARHDLSAYTNAAEVLFRFRLTTDASGTADGWYVDDITVSESPSVVDAYLPSDITSDAMRVNWVPNADENFSHYILVRSTSPSTSILTPEITTISDQGAGSYLDTGLSLDTRYYYRVYSFSRYSAFSTNGQETSEQTLNNPIPFVEDFEGGLSRWTMSGAWGTSTNQPFEGAACLMDSPVGTYGNNEDSFAKTAVNLLGSTWPVLIFHDRYSIAPADWGYAEVSTDGVNWTRVYGVDGSQTDWREKRVDLSQWKTAENLRIRFHLTSDTSTTADGWSVDAVSVVEHSALPTGVLPLYERFEGGLTNWICGTWTVTTNEALDGAYSAVDTEGWTMGPDSYNALVYAGELDLSGTTNPVVTAWFKGSLAYRTRLRVQHSVNHGISWADLASYSYDLSWSDWTRVQVSIPEAARIDGVRFRVVTWSEYGTQPDQNIYLDKLTLEERPPPANIDTLTPSLKTIQVNWGASPMSGFASNVLVRSESANVTMADTTVFTSANNSVTNFTDSGLSIGATYYYRMFTFNTNGTYTASGERSDNTVPMHFPITDSMDDLSNWVATGSWGVDANDPSEGSGCLSDSPVGDYLNSSDSYVLTAVDMQGSIWPILVFHDRYSIAAADWGYAEVSTDGSGWTRVYGVDGSQTDWREKRVDLSQWKTAENLRIRFHLTSDTSTTADGWSIDAVSVVEHSALPTTSLPLYERFEGGLTNWICGTWTVTTNEALDGAYSAVDTEGWTMGPDSYNALVYAGELDLSGTTNPVVTAWFKGSLAYRTRLRVQHSVNHGISWADLASYSYDLSWSDWTRVQVSIPEAARIDGVRFRVVTWSEYGTQPDQNIYFDKLTLEELPPPANIDTLTPSLKTIQVNWGASPMSGFASNVLVRSESANVTMADTTVFTSANNSVTNFTDSGLSIGATYYYRMFTFNTNGTYTASGERSDNTVPMHFPITDSMDDLSNWVATGSWGVDANDPSEGSGCLSDSPVGDYLNSSDSYVLTAVDMRGSTWPVLIFQDRHSIAAADWGYVEVSTDGVTWTRVYGVDGSQTDWREKRVDLSEWKTAENLRIRFHLTSDTSTTADGWSIDAVSVVEHSALPTTSLPLYERFEGGLTNWISGTWTVTTNEALDGVWSAVDTEGFSFGPNSYNALVYAGELDLSGTTNPVVTAWFKGSLAYRTRLRVQHSVNHGISWADLASYSYDLSWSDWTRVQVSIPEAARIDGVRFRVVTWSEYGTQPDQNIYLDKLTLEENPISVVLNVPDQISTDSMRLTWSAYPTDDFEAYRLYRSLATGVSESSTLLTTVTNVAQVSFQDALLQARRKYYYRVYAVTTNGTSSASNESSARTLGAETPWTDDFSSLQPVWTLNGSWYLAAGTGRNGGAALTDSPGDYTANSDTYALTALDLTGMDWPVLRFWDRALIVENDWGYIEISTNDGASWQRIYGIYGNHIDWREHQIDLSPWKNADSLWLRFRMTTGASDAADGWYIDDLSVTEHVAEVQTSLQDGFEMGATNWLEGGWTVDTNAYAGNAAIRDFGYGRIMPDTSRYLSYGAPLDLGGIENPLLTFWYKGTLSYRTRFRCQISIDGGLGWTDLHAVNYEYNGSWQRFQTSLQTYTSTPVRLRFVTWSEYGSSPDIDMYLDNIGIGGVEPGAPSALAPTMYESIGVVRPVLSVMNARDPQSDPLTYRFEVYEDEAASNIVAQVPSIASGYTSTAWKVDVNLPNNAQYWWRAQASDGSNAGPWMATSTFYVNETNTPPLVVSIASPPKGATLRTANGLLSWFPTSDPDVGDEIITYHIQIDNDPGFGSPDMNVQMSAPIPPPTGAYVTIARPLASLSGWENLNMINNYFWRIRAQDSRFSWSGWTSGKDWFIYGVPAPEPAGMTMNGDGSMTLSWAVGTENWYVLWAPDLSTTNWLPVAGPLGINSWSFTPDSGAEKGFYRVVGE